MRPTRRRADRTCTWTGIQSSGLHAWTTVCPSGCGRRGGAARWGRSGRFRQRCAAAPSRWPSSSWSRCSTSCLQRIVNCSLRFASADQSPPRWRPPSAAGATLARGLSGWPARPGRPQPLSAGRSGFTRSVSPQPRAAHPAWTGRHWRQPGPETPHGPARLRRVHPLAHRPLLLSVHQIAQQLRIPPTEASTVSARSTASWESAAAWTAVSVAYERGLLR